MKRERILTVLSATVLALAVGLGCAGSVASAYFRPWCMPYGLTPTADFGTIALWCAGLGLAMSLCSVWKKGYLVILVLLPLGALLWWQGSLGQSMEALCRTVSRAVDRAYGTGVLMWSDDRAFCDCTQALCALSVLPVLVTAWCVAKPARALWAVLAAILPMSLCVLMLDRVPDSKWLMLLMLGLLLVLLTGAIRRQNRQQGNILGLIMLLPAAAAVLMLFWLVPREGYHMDTWAMEMQKTVVSWFKPSTEQVPGKPSVDGPGERPLIQESVDLTHLGRRRERAQLRMTLRVTQSGTYYLRGRAYDVYTGTGWGTGMGNPDLPQLPPSGYLPRGSMEIITVWSEPLLYTPYYVPGELGTGRTNEVGITHYGYECARLPEHPNGHLTGSPRNLELLKALPESTRLWALEVLSSLGNTGDMPEAIRNYVSERAEYDLEPSRMPAGEPDFARWFMTRADRGYCVHFASSAVVLLRAAGYPARYVTGYLVEAHADGENQVLARDAHAWAEYWTPEAGWQVMEATPAGEHLPEPTAPAQTEESTTASSEPEMPTESFPMESAPTETAHTTEPTRPEGQGTLPEKPPSSGAAGIVFLWVCVAACTVFAAVAQRGLRLRARKQARSRGTPNEQALTAWRQLEQLAGLSGEAPEEAVRALALKAKFSNHTLTPEELHCFERALYRQQHLLQRKPWYRRLVYRWVLCVY